MFLNLTFCHIFRRTCRHPNYGNSLTFPARFNGAAFEHSLGFLQQFFLPQFFFAAAFAAAVILAAAFAVAAAMVFFVFAAAASPL